MSDGPVPPGVGDDANDAPSVEPTPEPAITPPAMLGVLGGGQLGRYFVMAARTMGYRTTVLDPDPHAPAGAIADVHLTNAFDDAEALRRLADTCAVVTSEFENAPAEALHAIADRTLLRPSPGAIAICQSRLEEKRFLDELGVPIVPWRPVVVDDDLDEAMRAFSYPAILKTARLGYDGKGQVLVERAAGLEAAWAELGRVPCTVEQRLRITRELSVVLARTPDGVTACYPVAQNQHQRGVLDTTHVPAALPSGGQEQAEELCTYIAEELGFVGVMAVEMFVYGRSVFVNELAPRPHNSGHFTLDACATSQFEQQVRAVCGLGLGSTALSVPGVAMVNLLGDLWADGEPDWSQVLSDPAAHLHLYGKQEARPGRKMGHLTVTSGTALGSASLARRLRNRL